MARKVFNDPELCLGARPSPADKACFVAAGCILALALVLATV